MVRAIKFWGRAAKVLADIQNPDNARLPLTGPSRNGIALFDEQHGLDPYLELSGSLWLLHWWMLQPVCLLPVWWLAFNDFEPVEFSEEDLLRFAIESISKSSKWSLPVEASIKKDVDCLLRMYAPNSTGRLALDDLLDCPFRELGLLEPVWDDRKRFRFALGPKPTLPPAIVAYACLDYLQRVDPNSHTITTSRLSRDTGGPGRAFKLTEEALVAAIQLHTNEQTSVGLTATAGIRQLRATGEVHELAKEALETYFRASGYSVSPPLILGAAGDKIKPEIEPSAATVTST